ncbi:MAG: hypothetical protein RBR03_07825 [Desulfuromonas thiophila]|jgi:hypothetical protein|nr:hypothetical protein [Desulfuromonas thiophila]MDY0398550.1 hypothetical protein [Desulfuromonas thiophila]
MTESAFIPIEQAARQLGTTPVALLLHLKHGLLRGRQQPDGQWRIDPASLAAFRARNGNQPARLCRATGHHCGGCGAAGETP